MADKEAFFVVVGVDKPARDPVRIVADDLASLGYLAADDVAYMPFCQEDRLALRMGESSHKGHEFVRETANAIKGIPDLYNITCDEIAWKLNKLGTPMPRGGRWNGRLVFHFTRHYMQIRPAFFEEDVPKKAPF